MNVLWILVALGVLWWILTVWEDAGEVEHEIGAAPSAEPDRGWRLVSSGVSRVVVIVVAAAVGFVIQFGPWLILDALSPDDRGQADADSEIEWLRLGERHQP